MIDFNPCGMIVDYLRGCYRTKARLSQAHPTRESEITWFFCNPGAKPLPHSTRFASLNWDNDSKARPSDGVDNSLGEIAGRPRPFYHGLPLDRPPGLWYCGPRSHFNFGSTRVV